jgi:hypothetical protein
VSPSRKSKSSSASARFISTTPSCGPASSSGSTPATSTSACSPPTASRSIAFYAQIYRQAKEEYQRRNESGSYAELAAQTLSKKNIGEDTLARGRLEKGYLPDAQIHGRAKRKAVKLFLSHYWQVAYEVHFRRPAPRPWIIEHGGHIDLIPVPGYDELRRSLYP